MDWFRFHTNAIDNRKVQTMPRRLTLDWLNFMCLQRINKTERGVDELPDIETCAFRLRCSVEKAGLLRDELIRLNFIDKLPNGAFVMHDWDEWQRRSDDAAERKRRQRSGHPKQSSRDTGRDTSRDMSRDSHTQCLNAEGDIEREGEESRTETPPTPSSQNGHGPGAAGDDFQEFRTAAETAGMNGSEPDWDEARFEWKVLSFEQKLSAVQGLQARAGTDDPALKALPRNYLKRRMWERRIQDFTKRERRVSSVITHDQPQEPASPPCEHCRNTGLVEPTPEGVSIALIRDALAHGARWCECESATCTRAWWERVCAIEGAPDDGVEAFSTRPAQANGVTR